MYNKIVHNDCYNNCSYYYLFNLIFKYKIINQFNDWKRELKKANLVNIRTNKKSLKKRKYKLIKSTYLKLILSATFLGKGSLLNGIPSVSSLTDAISSSAVMSTFSPVFLTVTL